MALFEFFGNSEELHQRKLEKTLAKALIQSKTNYCNAVYGQLSKHLINRLQRVRKTTAGYFYGWYVKPLM